MQKDVTLLNKAAFYHSRATAGTNPHFNYRMSAIALQKIKAPLSLEHPDSEQYDLLITDLTMKKYLQESAAA